MAKAVDAAFALLVFGGVPEEVVVDDGIVVALEVDAFREAVCCDEDVFWVLGEFVDGGLAGIGVIGA